jgi:hypothetical protein
MTAQAVCRCCQLAYPPTIATCIRPTCANQPTHVMLEPGLVLLPDELTPEIRTRLQQPELSVELVMSPLKQMIAREAEKAARTQMRRQQSSQRKPQMPVDLARDQPPARVPLESIPPPAPKPPKGYKLCKGPCGRTLPLVSFHHHPLTTGGRMGKCRSCKYAAQRKRLQATP